MKKTSLLCFLGCALFSCKQEIKPQDLAKINGYWEIKTATLPSGKDKEYAINESFDYFEIKNNKGFRKKVMPQLNGTFIVNNTSEKVSVRFAKNHVFLDYNTPYAKWTEELTSLSDSLMVLENSQKASYSYKKTGPINLLAK